jgi:hypothetical protein
MHEINDDEHAKYKYKTSPIDGIRFRTQAEK